MSKLKSFDFDIVLANIIISIAAIFSILKVAGIIDWAWWIVLSPIWVPFVLAFTTTVTAFIVLGLWAVVIHIAFYFMTK